MKYSDYKEGDIIVFNDRGGCYSYKLEIGVFYKIIKIEEPSGGDINAYAESLDGKRGGRFRMYTPGQQYESYYSLYKQPDLIYEIF